MKVGVVACSKTKADVACPAVDLYRGRTFVAAVRHLRGLGCERIVILSALHLALLDTEVVAPYEWCLDGLDAASRRHWSVVARGKLCNLLHELGATEVHAIVPRAYEGALIGLRGVTRHFEGLPQGRLYSALAARREP